ncbi:glycogen-binding subunit 76A isoform X1 [Pseudomyrmex gracilis]|uniref:glycogen-binding subunit 76A isoform X1 n=2 Tax=Pseudomyrmex gracilis TaxID=219809 RepID=UPI000994B620|nr:glycogen-binding subunit 76A isoform X1 [Pseudomyrmex gracilis]
MIKRTTRQESKIPTQQTSLMSGSVTAGRGDDSTSPSPSSEVSRNENTAGSAVQNMGSTDSAGNARGPSCSLVSTLLSNNCRGSAEAFARCLHRRLTSLGSENGSPERVTDAAKPLETSWLHPTSSSNRHVNSLTANNQHSIHQHQPRHSPESDLFYDIEVDDEPGSPAEEATAAEMARLLVNSKTNYHDACHCSSSATKTSETTDVHQDPESGCVFASPFSSTPPDSDSSEMFFDPESSESEKPKVEVFFDPVSTSDSEAASNLSNASVHAKAAQSNERRRDTNPERCEDTSESSCSSRRNPAICKNGHRQDELIGSSEDSFGRSSQETTTSPSHESLWSTFDDSTVSLQDESPSRGVDRVDFVPHICLPKSHSDSELPSNGVLEETSIELDNRNGKDGENKHIGNIDVENTLENVANDVRNGTDLDDSSDVVDSEEKGNFTDVESEEVSSNSLSEPKIEETVVSDSDTELTFNSAADTSDAATDCSNSTGAKNELNLQIGNDSNAASNNDEEKLCLLLKKLGSSTSAKEEDLSPEQETQSETVEEEEDRPQRVRRCSSLKTGKTPPGTPGRKKIVRFADKLGLDLADVRTFLDEIPKIPNSAYNDLIYDDIFRPQHSSPENAASSIRDDWCDRYQDDGRRKSMSAISSRKIDRMLVPLFQQPGGMANFLDVVRERRVCLENALVQDPVTLAIQGTVRVINLDFHKSVHIRYTLNAWRNFSDLQATYVCNSCDGFSDKFSFVLYCHTLSVGQRLEFAVRFQCKGMQYWDNNSGANYCFQCLPASSSTGYIPITADENRRSSWSPMFY